MTYRELVAAAEAVRNESWDHTAALICNIRNSAFGAKKKTRMQDVHPYRKRTAPRRATTKAEAMNYLDKVFS